MQRREAMNAVEMFRQKFATYKKIADQSGEQKAWDTLFDGYPERQQKNMGRFFEKHDTLAEAFSEAVPIYKQIGMDMQVVDISNRGKDAVLEIQRTCPCLVHHIHEEFGFAKPCHVICEMDIAATEAAFPGLRGSILARQADGDCVCMFKYERNKK